MSELEIVSLQIANLHQKFDEKKTELDQLQKELVLARLEIERLKAVLDTIKKLVFGAMLPSAISLLVMLVNLVTK